MLPRGGGGGRLRRKDGEVSPEERDRERQREREGEREIERGRVCSVFRSYWLEIDARSDCFLCDVFWGKGGGNSDSTHGKLCLGEKERCQKSRTVLEACLTRGKARSQYDLRKVAGGICRWILGTSHMSVGNFGEWVVALCRRRFPAFWAGRRGELQMSGAIPGPLNQDPRDDDSRAAGIPIFTHLRGTGPGCC